MLFPHSGRVGFEDQLPDQSVPTPAKDVVCAMLRRETELRNAPHTQRALDELDETDDEAEPETLEEAQSVIAKLRAQLKAMQRDNNDNSKKEKDLFADLTTDSGVFMAIKAAVVKEFGLAPEAINVLNTAVARFPGDADIVAAANYLTYNRAVQGTLAVGDTVPADTIHLAALDGNMSTLAEHLATPGDNRPVAIVAGSIT